MMPFFLISLCFLFLVYAVQLKRILIISIIQFFFASTFFSIRSSWDSNKKENLLCFVLQMMGNVHKWVWPTKHFNMLTDLCEAASRHGLPTLPKHSDWLHASMSEPKCTPHFFLLYRSLWKKKKRAKELHAYWLVFVFIQTTVASFDPVIIFLLPPLKSVCLLPWWKRMKLFDLALANELCCSKHEIPISSRPACFLFAPCAESRAVSLWRDGDGFKFLVRSFVGSFHSPVIPQPTLSSVLPPHHRRVWVYINNSSRINPICTLLFGSKVFWDVSTNINLIELKSL